MSELAGLRMLDEERHFRLHKIAKRRRNAMESRPSGLDWRRRVLRIKGECRPNADAPSRLCDAGFNSDGAYMHPEWDRGAAWPI